MSQSQLIQLRESLQTMLVNDPITSLGIRQNEIDLIKLKSKVVDESFTRTIQNLSDKLVNRTRYINDFLEDYIEEIDEVILQQTFDFMREDNIHWDAPNVKYRTADYNRNFRQLEMSDDTFDIVRGRIGTYTDWKYPGLEIGPGDSTWTKMLVASDPLYVVDYNDEFLASTKASFNERYQGRLRCYLNNGYSLYMLPQNQFGFVFSWNMFNYLSFNQINHYLREIHNVLRPGGGCMFSYNNGERALSALRSEEQLMSFIPETILKKVVRKHGFTDIKTENLDSTISWIEFRKPGELSSAKAAQAVGKIILKHHVEA